MHGERAGSFHRQAGPGVPPEVSGREPRKDSVNPAGDLHVEDGSVQSRHGLKVRWASQPGLWHPGRGPLIAFSPSIERMNRLAFGFLLGKKVLALAAGLVPLGARLFQWGMSNGPYFN